MSGFISIIKVNNQQILTLKERGIKSMNLFEVLFRVMIIFSVLLLMARLNGAKQISQMSFYDYISGITVGSLAATISIDDNISFLSGLCAIIFYLGASLLINILTQKNLPLSNLLTGKPLILIHQGKIQWNNMKKSKLTMSELLSNLRVGGYFNINDVYQAVLETSGKISVLPKGYARKVQNNDLKLNVSDPLLVTEVIMDGVIMNENLTLFKKDSEWLKNQLKSKQLDLAQIALAILDENGQLTFYLK